MKCYPASIFSYVCIIGNIPCFGTLLVARLQGNQIVIELDHNNKPLIDALEGRGIPRDRIVLAYLDETTLA